MGLLYMGILLKNILAILPEGNKDLIKETDIYIEGNRIAAIGKQSLISTKNM